MLPAGRVLLALLVAASLSACDDLWTDESCLAGMNTPECIESQKDE